MKQKTGRSKPPAEQVIKDIRRVTRRHFSAEDKIRIVLEGLLLNVPTHGAHSWPHAIVRCCFSDFVGQGMSKSIRAVR